MREHCLTSLVWKAIPGLHGQIFGHAGEDAASSLPRPEVWMCSHVACCNEQNGTRPQRHDAEMSCVKPPRGLADKEMPVEKLPYPLCPRPKLADRCKCLRAYR
jgi:hypothetical protein